MSDYASKYYNVPADIGRRVTVDGKPGIIAEDRGHYIGVNFDADRPGHISNCHPTWRVEYLGMGRIRRMTKSQRRYQRYLEVGECFDSFKDFLRYEASLAGKCGCLPIPKVELAPASGAQFQRVDGRISGSGDKS